MAGVETRVDEDRLIRDLLAGEWSDLTQERGYDPQCKPILAAALLKRLVLGRDPRAHNLPAGARIRGVRLDGDLDLADCYGPQGGGLGVLALEECDLPGRINVSNTELARLSIRKSRFRELWGEGVQVRGDLDFRESSPLPTDDASIPGSAYIRLRAAEIGGDVWGRGATLRSPPEVPEGLTVVPPALQLWLAKIGGSLSFEMRFDCSGEFKINGATIGGDLSLDGARLSNPDGMALDAAGARIGGEATFHTEGEHRFEADGEVRLSNGSIGRDCEFMGARLSNPGGDALDLSGCKIGGHLRLMSAGNHRFESQGKVLLWNARVSSDLACYGSHLSNPNDIALGAAGIQIGGNALLLSKNDHRFEAEGGFVISGATIGGDLALSGARLSSPERDALDASGCSIGGKLHAHDNLIGGDVDLSATRTSILGSFAPSAWDGADRIRLDGIGISQIQVDPEDGVPWKQRRNWLRRSSFREHGGRLIVSPHPWRECASAFARSGRHSDARRLQREGYREENRARPKWQQPFVWLFAETPFGFGLSIFRTTVTVLCFWLVGTVGVEVMSARGVLIETNEDGLQRACQSVVAPLYALDVAIPFIDLRQEFRCDPGDMGQAGLFAGIAIPAVSLPGPSTIDATSSSTIRMFDEVTVWHWAKAIYALLGALVVGFAAVTYSGVFKPKE